MISATIPLHAEFHYGGPLRGRPPDVREITKLSLRGSPALDHGLRSTAGPPHSDFHYASLRPPRAQAVVQFLSLHRHPGEQKRPMKNSVSWFSRPRPPNPKQDDSTKLFLHSTVESYCSGISRVVDFRGLTLLLVDSTGESQCSGNSSAAHSCHFGCTPR